MPRHPPTQPTSEPGPALAEALDHLAAAVAARVISALAPRLDRIVGLLDSPCGQKHAEPAELLAVPEAARLAGISERTLRRLSKAGAAPPVIKLTDGRQGAARISRDAILGWIARGCSSGPKSSHQPGRAG